MPNGFRYDINGLRAYAVVLVVLFHFGILGFSAGFIGVDIFFVISGYLMTGIVIKSLDKGNFSIINFYLSRGIRIVPALFVVCVLLLILGWFFLLPQDYKSLGLHSLSSINFFSNIVYWRESGYFDTSSHNKALLHTWSLSLEWQFYLVFPIIVALLYKVKNSHKFIALCFLAGIIFSLILAILIPFKNAIPGFFLLPFRAWELLLGGMIFFIPKEKVPFPKFTEIAGFSLIVISCFLFTEQTTWPSYNALVPVLGAFFILLANQQNSIFTKPKLLQWLGNNSYSIYLWHWPIVFFLHYFYKNDELLFIVSGILLSLVLGWLSYTLIENPTRKFFSSISKVKAYSIWFSSIILLSLLSLLIFELDGIKKRFPLDTQKIDSAINDKNPRAEDCMTSEYSKQLKSCTYGSGPVKLLVIGDSHSSSMLNGVINALPKNTSLIHWWIPGCPTVIGLKKTDDPKNNCGNLVKDFVKQSNNYPDTPILVINRLNILFSDPKSKITPTNYITEKHLSYSNEYYIEMTNAYISTLNKLAKNHSVYITSPLPEAKVEIPTAMEKLILFNINNNNLLYIKYEDYKSSSKNSLIAQKIAIKNKKIKLIKLSDFFCNDKYCHFTLDNQPLLRDADHMTYSQSKKLVPFFKTVFE
ncbi:acyltransferase family protein [Acinetobacter soli]|uniref:acyltransferase family protein n=1 Tax=Acinetobacter soli TaxID=487316 RepID=UPI00321861DA